MDKPTDRFDVDTHVAEIREQGFTVIPDFMDAATIARVRDTLAPYQERYHGRNSFEGYKTERIYTLVARGQVFEELAVEPRILAILDRFLLPGYLLTASQSIQINPGEAPQDLHFDDVFYRQKRPRPPISMTMIAAVDDFTQANGCTEAIPGSHLWGDMDLLGGDELRLKSRAELEAQLVPMEMPAGACFVMAGTCIHRGGGNRTDRPRLGFTNQYCEPWGRTQENFFLGIPQERARAMSPRLQTLLGYDLHPPFMGMISSIHPRKALDPDWIPPVVEQAPAKR